MPSFSEMDHDHAPRLRYELVLLVKTTAARRNLAWHCGKRLRSCLGSGHGSGYGQLQQRRFPKGKSSPEFTVSSMMLDSAHQTY